jgi:hypothetical protein
MELVISGFDLDCFNIAVPMNSKANMAMVRAVPYCDARSRTDGFLIECDEAEARDLLKHVEYRYPSVVPRVLDAFRAAKVTP